MGRELIKGEVREGNIEREGRMFRLKGKEGVDGDGRIFNI